MSLEAALATLTKSIDRNNELLEQNLTVRKELAGKAQEVADTIASGKGGKAAAGKPAAGKAASKAKEPTEADLRKVFGDFLAVDDVDERNSRKEWVKALLDHFGADKATNLPAENWTQAIAFVKAKAAGEEVSFTSDEGGDDLV